MFSHHGSGANYNDRYVTSMLPDTHINSIIIVILPSNSLYSLTGPLSSPLPL